MTLSTALLLLSGALLASLLAGFLLATELRFLHRKTQQMSASFDRLKSAVAAVEARVALLETQVTPDSELDAISTQLEALASPTIPAPAPAAE